MPYHITPAYNVSAITGQGLKPGVGPRAQKLAEPRPAIYLFPTLDDAEDAYFNWLGEELENEGPLALLAVALPADVATYVGAGYEIVVAATIPGECVSVMSLDLDAFDWQSVRHAASSTSWPGSPST